MSNDKKIYTTPLVRKFARELGADISEIKGTARQGRITEKDIKNYIYRELRPSDEGKSIKRKEIKSEIKFIHSDFGEVEIKDIPINKWINVVLRCQGRKMDTYVNGTIVHRHVFNSVPKQNYGDVWVTQRGGFDGMLSSLRYFSHALTGVEVENLVKAGPNLTADDSLKIFPPYFALRWFFSKPVLSQ